MLKINLQVVSQEKELLNTQVEAVNVPTSEGEITILPDHVPLITKIQVGELRYQNNHKWNSIVVSNGFMTVSPNNKITVMVDSATHARDISLGQAQSAVKKAQESMRQSKNRREMIMAEASLRLALLEMKVAQKSKKSKI